MLRNISHLWTTKLTNMHELCLKLSIYLIDELFLSDISLLIKKGLWIQKNDNMYVFNSVINQPRSDKVLQLNTLVSQFLK